MSSSNFTKTIISRLNEELKLGEEDFCHLVDIQSEVFDAFLANHQAEKNKYKEVSEYNVNQCALFCLHLQKFLIASGASNLADKVYYFTRVKFNMDIYPTRKLPERFLLVHPIGTILGDANYGNWLVLYQCVTVGGNPKLEYP